ncbi:hypothetical protein JCM10212_005073 [Sporobolomyces blumeae]
MAFAREWSRLLDRLGDLPPTAPAHVQRLVIRLERAKLQAQGADGIDGLERLVRLKGRLSDLREGCDDLVVLGTDAATWKELAAVTARALEALESEMSTATTAATIRAAAAQDRRRSRSSSAEPPRRQARGGGQGERSTTRTSGSTLDAFLARLPATARPAHPSLSDLAARRAKALSEAYSLFLLCTSPSSVLPHGQILSSIFHTAASCPATPTVPTSLASRLSQQAYRAYFDHLSDELSESSTPSRQRDAWAQLSQDLADSALPLIPSRLGRGSVRSAMQEALSRPRRPTTSWTVEQGRSTLRDLVETLRRLCAPARDAQVASVLASIDSALTPRTVVEAVEATLALANDMSDDLERYRTHAQVQLATDEQVLDAVKEEAGERERKAVRELFPRSGTDPSDADEKIRSATAEWVVRSGPGDGSSADPGGQRLDRGQVARAFVECLFRDSAVALPPLPTEPSSSRSSSPVHRGANILPPILYATSPRLFELQNTLQALVILACLVTVVPPPPLPASSQPASASSPSTSSAQSDYLSRLWTVLESEFLQANPSDRPSSATSSPAETIPTRLAHLSDELIAHRRSLLRLSRNLSDEEKTRIASSVERILRYEDPVFKLLKHRLKDGIAEAVLESAMTTNADRSVPPSSLHVPTHLRTGRTPPSTNSARPFSSLADLSTPASRRPTVHVRPIKGFERLSDRVDRVVQEKLVGVLAWVDEVWGDVLGWESR